MSNQDDRRWAYLLVNLSTLLWASNIALGRALRNQVGPATLTATRFSVAALLFYLILRLRHNQQLTSPRGKQEWLLLLGMGLLGIFAFPTLLYLALRYTTATNVALIEGTTPLVTAFLAALILSERLTRSLLIGALISLFGVALVISNASLASLRALQFNRGDLIALIIVFFWGLYSILGRIATRRRSSLYTTAFSTWLALPLLIGLASFEWRTNHPQLTPFLLLSVIYIGIFPSVIAFLSWNEGVRRAGPNQTMAFYNMLVVYGTILGVLFLGETLTWHNLIGGVFVIGGGLLITLGERKPIQVQENAER
jgi:drug/metabolite transporter (DMT)-like permease